MTVILMFVPHWSLQDLVALLTGVVHHLAKIRAGAFDHNNCYWPFI
jgi:hypothetical protein